MLPVGLEEVLGEDIYKRENPNEVHETLVRLGVEVSDTFLAFYGQYAGPFWEEHVPFELLDIVEEERNIESYTNVCRKEHGFPNHYLVISEMSANTVLVLDTVMDKVYRVNFEGGDESLIKGELKESWGSFDLFLRSYFSV